MLTPQQSRNSHAANKQRPPHTKWEAYFLRSDDITREEVNWQRADSQTGKGTRATTAPRSAPTLIPAGPGRAPIGSQACVSLTLWHQGHGAPRSSCSVSQAQGLGGRGDWGSLRRTEGGRQSRSHAGRWGRSAGMHALPTPPANSMRHADSQRSLSLRGARGPKKQRACAGHLQLL